jgi:hypothetical protein
MEPGTSTVDRLVAKLEVGVIPAPQTSVTAGLAKASRIGRRREMPYRGTEAARRGSGGFWWPFPGKPLPPAMRLDSWFGFYSRGLALGIPQMSLPPSKSTLGPDGISSLWS